MLYAIFFFPSCNCCCCNYGCQHTWCGLHISVFSQLQWSNSVLCTMQRLKHLQPELCELILSSTSYHLFATSNTLTFEHPTITKVSIDCRKAEEYHYLWFCNGWGVEFWDTCSVMRIGWEALKEHIFSVVYCIQSWRDINISRTGKNICTAKACPSPSGRVVQYSERAEEAFKVYSSFSLYHGDNATVWIFLRFTEVEMRYIYYLRYLILQ